MSLPSGTHLGTYRILAPLGAGGMGEVYRAHDERLGRDVAIKVLSGAFGSDGDRLRRFQQEARVLASLSHPNVVQIFEAGEHEGSPYLVMELLEGETLRERMRGKALPPKRAAELAREAAQGLAAAHERGILHRDLKPENLFLTREGRVKVLDFGLAKARSAPAGSRVETEAFTAALSEPGQVVGTSGYMSPEQVRGETTDARSDLFSLGVVLWEMVTGAKPFRGDSSIEVMHAILKEEPPDLPETLKVTPPLERILRSCLAKAPEGRFHSAHDLAFALDNLQESSSSATRNRPLPAPFRAWRVPAAGLAGALLVLGWVGLARARGWAPFQAAPQPVFRRLTYREGEILAARFLPDGKEVVVGGAWNGGAKRVSRITVSNREEKETDLEGHLVSVSASGLWAIATQIRRSYSFGFSGTLALGPIGDSRPREMFTDILCADLSLAGTLALVRNQGGLRNLECPPGKVIDTDVRGLTSLRFSTDGTRLAFCRGVGGNKRRVEVHDLRTGRTTRWSGDHKNLQGLAWRGDEVWFSAGDRIPDELFAVKAGGAERVVYRANGHIQLHDIGAGGEVLMSQGDWRAEVLAWSDDQPVPRVFERKDNFFLSDASGDGRWLVGNHIDPSGRTNVALFRTDGSPPVLLDEGGTCTLSPDGRWVVATVMARGPKFQLLPTGLGLSRNITVPGLEEANYARLLEDGKHLLVWGSEAGRPWRMFRADLEGAAPVALTPEGAALGADLPRLSPDGRRLIVEYKNAYRVARLDEPLSEPEPIQGLAPGEQVAGWTADARTLYVYLPGYPPLRISKLDPATGRRQAWKGFACEAKAEAQLDSVMVTPDGRHVAAQSFRNRGILFLVEGLR
ncbi:hypothetical protein GETHLI_13480 [Geothrix limicola]|uniref:Protein kinase domain-containing protein n=1 Tax=Geothrix limicola TaxID=2927978 RepID=A0ABQ5QEJ6_9BACT|nr:serine/threonine-protein kinase [Geothrix limicola]GLH72846.1 hypothetical protein GETHLI_13480 [Geothrix limicola]